MTRQRKVNVTFLPRMRMVLLPANRFLMGIIRSIRSQARKAKPLSRTLRYSFPPSVVLAILAALFFALYAVLGKRETAQVGTIVVTCGSFLFGSVELLVLLLLGHTGPVSSFYGAVGLDMFQDVPLLQGINLQSLPYLLFIGIVSTGLGYVFHMFAIEKTSATHGSLVFFFKPILAPLVALAVLGEAITGPMVLGIVFFLAGSLMGILPEFLRNRRKAAPLPQHEGE